MGMGEWRDQRWNEKTFRREVVCDGEVGHGGKFIEEEQYKSGNGGEMNEKGKACMDDSA